MEETEKAKEIFGRFYYGDDKIKFSQREVAKHCAVIVVEEIIKACEYNHVESWNTDWWNRVRDEIKKL